MEYKKIKKAKDKIKGETLIKELIKMLKKIAWNTFKNTGNIDTFMEFYQVKNIEEQIKAETNGIIKNEGDNNSRT